MTLAALKPILADELKGETKEAEDGEATASADYRFPRESCSRSIASNKALKLPLPKLRLPLR